MSTTWAGSNGPRHPELGSRNHVAVRPRALADRESATRSVHRAQATEAFGDRVVEIVGDRHERRQRVTELFPVERVPEQGVSQYDVAVAVEAECAEGKAIVHLEQEVE